MRPPLQAFSSGRMCCWWRHLQWPVRPNRVSHNLFLFSSRPLKILNTTPLCVFVLFSSDTVDEDDDLYDFVEDEENKGDEIYEDLMRTEEPPEIVGVGVWSVERVAQNHFPIGSYWFLWCVHTATEDWRGQARVLPARDQADGGEILRYAWVYITGAQIYFNFFCFIFLKKFPSADFMLKHFQTLLCLCSTSWSLWKSFYSPKKLRISSST